MSDIGQSVIAGQDSRPTGTLANPVMDQIDADFARRFIERLLAAVNAHDAQAVADLCATDVV